MSEIRVKARSKPNRKKRVIFTLEAPEAKRVHVTGGFCDWQTDSYALKKGRDGTWRTTLPLSPGRHEYRFLVDGEWRDDPNCRERFPNPFGTENCVLRVLREEAEMSRSVDGNEDIS